MEEQDVQMGGPSTDMGESTSTKGATDSDMKMQEEGSDSEKAVKQMEFYFADSNLPFDRFMWSLHTENPEHWVPLEKVLSFKRMHDYKTLGLPWLAKTLRERSTELEVDEAGLNIRRTSEVQEPKGNFERSVYAKGFPDEDGTLQSKLEAYFNAFGKTNAVRMRRDDKKKFKNSVFAEFSDFKTVEVFLKADPKPSWEGKELLVMSKEDYCEMKIKEKGLTGKSAEIRRQTISSRGFNAFREMAKAKKQEEEANEKKEIYLEFMGSKILIHTDQEGKGTVKVEEVPFVKGSTMRFVGCGGNFSWTDIKEPLKAKFDDRPPYIKYAKGEDFGLVGFHKALSGEEVALVKETVKTLNGKEIQWSLLEGDDEEKTFQVERAQAAAKSALSLSHSASARGRARGRGGRGRGRGRHYQNRDRNSEKVTSVPDAGNDGDGNVGEKRKRAVEPDGGPDVGVRGTTGPPTVVASEPAGKKAKTIEV